MSDFDSDKPQLASSELTPQRISAIAAQLSAQSSQSLIALTRANTKRNGGHTPFVASIMRALRRVRVPPPPPSPTNPPSPSSTRRRPRQVSFAPTLTILVVKSDRSGLDISHMPLPPDRPLKSTLRRSRNMPRRLTLPELPIHEIGNRKVANRTPTPRGVSVRSVSSSRAFVGRRAQSDNFSSKIARSDTLQGRRKRPDSVTLPVRSSSSSHDKPPNVLRRRSTPRIESGMSTISTTSTSTDSSAVRTDSDSMMNLKRRNKAQAEAGQSPTSIQHQMTF